MMTAPHFIGYWLALAGVLVLSPDALLIKLSGNDPWQIMAWRGLISGAIILLYCHLANRSCTITCQLKPAGWGGVLGVTLATTFSGLCFIYAITHANVTDVLVIIAFAPLISALMSALFLKEQVLLRTWVATLVCGVGLAILLGQANSQSEPLGLMAAISCAVLLATQFVLMRNYPKADLTAAIGLGDILSGFIALFLAKTLILTDTTQALVILLNSAIIIPVPFILFALALRYITAAETSLIMLIESIVGSLWVWLFLGEAPSRSTVLAGALVLSTLAIYGFLTLREVQKQRANPV